MPAAAGTLDAAELGGGWQGDVPEAPVVSGRRREGVASWMLEDLRAPGWAAPVSSCPAVCDRPGRCSVDMRLARRQHTQHLPLEACPFSDVTRSRDLLTRGDERRRGSGPALMGRVQLAEISAGDRARHRDGQALRGWAPTTLGRRLFTSFGEH